LSVHARNSLAIARNSKRKRVFADEGDDEKHTLPVSLFMDDIFLLADLWTLTEEGANVLQELAKLWKVSVIDRV
jgi:hypothetical protein